MSFDYTTLITDRTAADVSRVKTIAAKAWTGMTDAEKNEWSAGIKGAYNASDLNRVGAASEDLASKFRVVGYTLPGYARIRVARDESESDALDPYTWYVSDVPTATQMEQYLRNIETLRSRITAVETTPETPESMAGLTVDKANAIEQILIDTDTLLARSQQAVYYSGELYAGEV